ncbi:phosphotransferase family protein [Candidatus Sumerlaeota bacterium]|nr:phosphotransferase family protein [Candidatus Sumerlaeota bacterium]
MNGITNTTRLSGGANQETWAFDAMTKDGRIPLILRRAPGGADAAHRGGKSAESETAGVSGNAGTLEMEAGLLRIVAGTGAPVPEVIRVLMPEDGLGPGFIMKRIEGETIAPKILRDEAFAKIRPGLARQCGQILAQIHATPVEQLPAISHMPVRDLIRRNRDLYDRYDHPHPVFDLAFRWLEDRVTESPRMTLVHGDFRNGNFIVGPEGIRAVLDWELAHVGDPMEDLGWICVNSWRFGNMDKPVGGFGEREDFYRAYEQAGGVVDRGRIHFWEILGTLKWGIVCMTMCDIFRSGRDRSLERAAIGRRASETEIDLLRLIEEEG